MSDLTAKEQQHVRTALRYLRHSLGSWQPLAKALCLEAESLSKIATGRRGVTASLALRVARFVDVAIDDLLAGKYLPTRTCPRCGYVPNEYSEDVELTAITEITPQVDSE